jgi:hypothetical protein
MQLTLGVAPFFSNKFCHLAKIFIVVEEYDDELGVERWTDLIGHLLSPILLSAGHFPLSSRDWLPNCNTLGLGPETSPAIPLGSLVTGADLIMRTKVGPPAAGSFEVIVVGLVEPYSKAFLAGLLSDMVVDVIVDRDLPLRDLPDVPWEGRGVVRHFPSPRSEITTPSSSSC